MKGVRKEQYEMRNKQSLMCKALVRKLIFILCDQMCTSFTCKIFFTQILDKGELEVTLSFHNVLMTKLCNKSTYQHQDVNMKSKDRFLYID